MLRIRMRRPGRLVKGRTHFKIVVIEGTAARESKFVAQVGYYDPTNKLLKFDVDQYAKWVKEGARPSETVASLFKRYKKAK